MPLGKEVGIGLGDIVLDGDSAPLHGKGHSSLPHFSTHVSCGQTVAHVSNCRALVNPQRLVARLFASSCAVLLLLLFIRQYGSRFTSRRRGDD